MQIKLLTPKDISAAALVHLEVLPDISSAIGPKAVVRLYQLLLSSPDNHLCLGAWEKNNLMGVITTSKNMDKTQKIMHNLLSPDLLLLLMIKTVSLSISPVRLIKRVLFERRLNKILPASHSNIVTLCVAKRFQGQGVGKSLVNKVIQHFQNLKKSDLYVDTRTDNAKALSFYLNLNFDIIEKSFDGIVLKRHINLAQKEHR